MAGFYKQIFCNRDNRFSVIIDDDERVVYAYLLDGESIVGDVWLYNRKPSPAQIDWKTRKEMPFLNPREFVKKEIRPVEEENEVHVEWTFENELKEVTIFIRNTLVAKIQPGSRPGWSTLVLKDGPLAKKL